MIQKVQNTVGAELRKNRGTSFCKICSVFLTHHKKIQPLLKLLLLEELKNMNFIVLNETRKWGGEEEEEEGCGVGWGVVGEEGCGVGWGVVGEEEGCGVGWGVAGEEEG
ncbi:hypothetical protein Pcinc_016251 [Petrolisthes cinctipes]|uniref:Uncharacterized protein n=1 Tax=Petrolisthes cinctipes TaxID=88211 RepID=A0AAE1KPX4_PETCI|nr:hypothetical protein Pcinc_016251 [Petrolisthes cinctipes]